MVAVNYVDGDAPGAVYRFDLGQVGVLDGDAVEVGAGLVPVVSIYADADSLPVVDGGSVGLGSPAAPAGSPLNRTGMGRCLAAVASLVPDAGRVRLSPALVGRQRDGDGGAVATGRTLRQFYGFDAGWLAGLEVAPDPRVTCQGWPWRGHDVTWTCWQRARENRSPCQRDAPGWWWCCSTGNGRRRVSPGGWRCRRRRLRW